MAISGGLILQMKVSGCHRNKSFKDFVWGGGKGEGITNRYEQSFKIKIYLTYNIVCTFKVYNVLI